MKYDVEVDAAKAYASVAMDGRLLFRLRLFASLDTVGGFDESYGDISVDVAGDVVTATAHSTVWDTRVTTTRFLPDRIETSTTVTGQGRLTEVHLLGGSRTPRGFPCRCSDRVSA